MAKNMFIESAQKFLTGSVNGNSNCADVQKVDVKSIFCGFIRYQQTVIDEMVETGRRNLAGYLERDKIPKGIFVDVFA